jgi:hypothetical protein
MLSPLHLAVVATDLGGVSAFMRDYRPRYNKPYPLCVTASLGQIPDLRSAS